ncbi:hypothetical protein GGR52DRAFT_547686 [Hypoxylon sp. FL1284]|nr:hypothetical protein GGR52DRAFT_547686 [Hypoxylon sp. FL1284]
MSIYLLLLLSIIAAVTVTVVIFFLRLFRGAHPSTWVWFCFFGLSHTTLDNLPPCLSANQAQLPCICMRTHARARARVVVAASSSSSDSANRIA